MPVDLKQLEYFVHVAELRSFTRAAALLHVAQPALSRQVRSLEVELKQTLLYRNGRGVNPTEAGTRLLAHALGILQQVGRARDELAATKGSPVGRVVVGAPPSVGKVLTVPLVRSFRAQFPNASLSMVDGLSVHIGEWLLTGRVDIGLVYNPVPSPSIETTPFLEEPLYLIGPGRGGPVARDAAVTLRQLSDYPLIMPSRPHAIRMYVETQLARIGLKPMLAFEIDGVPAILDLVHEGHGFAVLPGNSVLGDDRQRKLRANRIVNPGLTSLLVLATSAQRPATPLMRSTFDLLKRIGPRILAG